MTSVEFIVLLPWLLTSAALLVTGSVGAVARRLRRAKVPKAWMVRR